MLLMFAVVFRCEERKIHKNVRINKLFGGTDARKVSILRSCNQQGASPETCITYRSRCSKCTRTTSRKGGRTLRWRRFHQTRLRRRWWASQRSPVVGWLPANPSIWVTRQSGSCLFGIGASRHRRRCRLSCCNLQHRRFSTSSWSCCRSSSFLVLILPPGAWCCVLRFGCFYPRSFDDQITFVRLFIRRRQTAGRRRQVFFVEM